MADDMLAGVGTRQYVALKLLEYVAQGQGKATGIASGPIVTFENGTDEDWILDTYSRCLDAVHYPSKRVKGRE